MPALVKDGLVRYLGVLPDEVGDIDQLNEIGKPAMSFVLLPRQNTGRRSQ